MTIQKWNPFYEIHRLNDEMDKLFTGQWPVRKGTGVTPAGVMPVDIAETPTEVLIKAEIPGIAPEDVEVKVEDGVLTISGEKKFENVEGNKEGDKETEYLRVERYYGKFTRSFVVPRYVDSSNVKAEYNSGILTLTLPRREETQPKKIDVKVTSR
jgi:HSP20 family protein